MPDKENSLIEKAIQLAWEAHQGQKDRYGEPYILHPLRVMDRVPGREGKIIALLHDVVEDSNLTLENLREAGFSVEILNSVEALTKRPGEEYTRYIQRVARNKLTIEVKLADLEDNMDLRRCKELSETDLDRMNKYLRAWYYLKNIKKGK